MGVPVEYLGLRDERDLIHRLFDTRAGAPIRTRCLSGAGQHLHVVDLSEDADGRLCPGCWTSADLAAWERRRRVMNVPAAVVGGLGIILVVFVAFLAVAFLLRYGRG